MTVEFSPLAELDLERIGDYIATDNPQRALSFIREIRNRCLEISSAPEAGPLRNDLLPGIRMVVHGNYLIFYTSSESGARIVRILHGARDLAALLK